MKDFSREELEKNAEQLAPKAKEWIEFALRRLYADHKHTTGMEVVYGLTFEELIAALLAAQEVYKRQDVLMSAEDVQV